MTSCDSCGAALPASAERCPICGTPTAIPAADPAGRLGEVGLDDAECPRCGHRPPSGSRFCNRCGERLPTAPVPAADVPRARPSSDAGKRGLAVAGIGALAVVALWAATQFTGGEDVDTQELAASDVADIGEAAPVPEGTPPLPDSAQAAADRFAAEGTAEGWFESGRYYLTAAFETRQTNPESSVRFARRAISDFERSLTLEDAPPVRVALAEAATFDPSNPMRPVQELQAVLERDPDNVDATFLLGDLRLRIGRTEPAREAFERVVELTDPGDPLRRQAEAALASLAAP